MSTNGVRVFSLTLLSINSNQISFFLSENRCHSHWQHTGAVPGLPLSSCKDNTFSRNLQTFLPLLRVLLQTTQTFSQKTRKTKPTQDRDHKTLPSHEPPAEPPPSRQQATAGPPSRPRKRHRRHLPVRLKNRQEPHRKPTNETSKPNKRDTLKPTSATSQTVKRDAPNRQTRHERATQKSPERDRKHENKNRRSGRHFSPVFLANPRIFD